MFLKLYVAIAVAIALGFSSFAAAFDSCDHVQSGASAQQVSDEIDGLSLTFSLPQTTFAHRDIRCLVAPCPSGDAQVPFKLVLKNLSAETKTLTFPSSQMAELEILDASGASVGMLSASRSYAAMLTDLTLAPGEEKVLEDVLTIDRSVAGSLQAVVSVLSFEGLPRLAQAIEVLPAP